MVADRYAEDGIVSHRLVREHYEVPDDDDDDDVAAADGPGDADGTANGSGNGHHAPSSRRRERSGVARGA